MDLQGETRKREEFRNILFILAKKQDLLEDKQERISMYIRLESLYYAPKKEECFRHFYSDIFSVLTQIQNNPQLGDINILGQNLDIIRNGYKSVNKDGNGKEINISDSINKLYDHVSLDIARIMYSNAGDRKISGEETIEEIQREIKEIQSNIDEAKQFQRKNEKKIRKQQKEYIAILGIFAAVVLAFTAGIAFSASVLENISEVSIYRIVIVALIIGLVLINALFGLFYYIDRLVNKDKNIKPIIISNIVLIFLLFVTIAAWYFGIVELRNNRLASHVSSYIFQLCISTI